MKNLLLAKQIISVAEQDLDIFSFVVSEWPDDDGTYWLDIGGYSFTYENREDAENDCAEVMELLEI